MAGETKRVDALQLIFSVFLGALLVIVIGVGVWTFYPQPFDDNTTEQRKIEELYRQQDQIRNAAGTKEPNAVQQARIDAIQDEIDAIEDTMQSQRDEWAVTTSIILLTFATLLMAISLFLPEHMRVFSNGILLGGLFTIVYGTGWSFAGGDSRARFFVVLVALLLSVAFGYLRFIRGRKEKELAPAAVAGAGIEVSAQEAAALGALAARVEALEVRAAAAAAALSGTEATAEKD